MKQFQMKNFIVSSIHVRVEFQSRFNLHSWTCTNFSILCAAMIKIAGIKSNDKINFKEFVDFFYKVDWSGSASTGTYPRLTLIIRKILPLFATLQLCLRDLTSDCLSATIGKSWSGWLRTRSNPNPWVTFCFKSCEQTIAMKSIKSEDTTTITDTAKLVRIKSSILDGNRPDRWLTHPHPCPFVLWNYLPLNLCESTFWASFSSFFLSVIRPTQLVFFFFLELLNLSFYCINRPQAKLSLFLPYLCSLCSTCLSILYPSIEAWRTVTEAKFDQSDIAGKNRLIQIW